MTRRTRRAKAKALAAACLALALVLVFAATTGAHIERASYFPDPAPDKSVNPPAGGHRPQYRPLRDVLGPDRDITRVVCKDYSLHRLRNSLADAEQHGYKLRPKAARIPVSRSRAEELLSLNEHLRRMCSYSSIQAAVNDSGNNDRVVIMPGIYKEPRSRAAKTDDHSCAKYHILNDRGDTGAVSYEGQLKCPNDQNLIAVLGRAQGPHEDPYPAEPRADRHGIPNLGRCIRCNLQIEGSGISPNDVVVDGGNVAHGNGGPGRGRKDVGIRADRADGFYLRNVTVRHVNEHDVYAVETDGYVLNRIKTFYAGEYGVLTFVSDHGLIKNCDAKGNGDSGLYPGAAPDTGDQTIEAHRRYNQRITRCDSHHNALGYSGTDGNAVHTDHSNFYGNTMGISTDIFTASGHPGFPEDSSRWDHNRIFSNNFNDYRKGSDVKPSVPVPIGVGMWIAGGNHNRVDHNRIYDNWRRGTMLFAVPDAFVCPTKDEQNLHGCDPSKDSTSFNNQYFDNILGRAPNGAKRPNGVDFWWDSFPDNTGNCWHDNGPYTSDPPPSPTPGASVPGFLPEDCATSNGTGNPAAAAEELGCFAAIEQGGYDSNSCPWFAPPPKPTQGRLAYRAWEDAAQRRLAGSIDRGTACALAGRNADCDISTIRR